MLERVNISVLSAKWALPMYAGTILPMSVCAGYLFGNGKNEDAQFVAAFRVAWNATNFVC